MGDVDFWLTFGFGCCS